jgi:hypothetical protein
MSPFCSISSLCSALYGMHSQCIVSHIGCEVFGYGHIVASGLSSYAFQQVRLVGWISLSLVWTTSRTSPLFLSVAKLASRSTNGTQDHRLIAHGNHITLFTAMIFNRPHNGFQYLPPYHIQTCLTFCRSPRTPIPLTPRLIIHHDLYSCPSKEIAVTITHISWTLPGHPRNPRLRHAQAQDIIRLAGCGMFKLSAARSDRCNSRSVRRGTNRTHTHNSFLWHTDQEEFSHDADACRAQHVYPSWIIERQMAR